MAVCRSVDPCVVKHDQASVPCSANIGFDHVGAELDGEPKGSERLLGGVDRLAAMGDHERRARRAAQRSHSSRCSLDELVVVQVRVRGEDAVDLCLLSGRQVFGRVEAPAPRHQPLPAEDLVDAGDAASELVRDVEQRRVGVGELVRGDQRLGGNVAADDATP